MTEQEHKLLAKIAEALIDANKIECEQVGGGVIANLGRLPAYAYYRAGLVHGAMIALRTDRQVLELKAELEPRT
jgi:hypothetical protein